MSQQIPIKRVKERRMYMTPYNKTKVPLFCDLHHIKNEHKVSEIDKIVFEPACLGGQKIEISRSNANLAILELNVILKILRMDFGFNGSVKYSELVDRTFTEY